jgi:peptide/nickel transport system permease protein
MIGYIIRRTLQAIPLLFIISIISFLLMTFAPGDPVDMYRTPDASGKKADTEAIREKLGLNDPIYIQYMRWLGLVLQGNLGYSFEDGRPVTEKILERVPATLTLMGIGILLSFLIAIPIGVYSAIKKNSWFDYLTTIYVNLGVSIPTFWLALMAILIFSLKLDWFPPSGMREVYDHFDLVDRIQHLILPLSVLLFGLMASKSRYMRSSMLEVIRQDYIRTARSKGLSERKVIFKHALRNALLPIITIIGFQIPGIFSGSLFIEQIFAWPGMGRLAINAIYVRDYQTIMGVTMIASVLVIIGNLLADVLYAIVDPRIQFGKRA